MDTGLDVPDDPQWPWLRDFRAYVDVLEQVPEGWMAIRWWGVSTVGSKTVAMFFSFGVVAM